MKRKWLVALGLAAALTVAACGDDDDDPTATETADSTTPASVTASATEGSGDTPGGTGMNTSFGDNGIATVALSESEHDRFIAVAAADDGSFYATGFVNQAGDQAMVLAKFNEDGTPDSAFGEDGVAIVNVASGGKTAEVSRAVVVTDDGKIVIAGPVEHDTSATGDAAKDTDVAVVRFNEDGTLDGDFGDEGIAIIDLGQGRQVNENSFVGDNSWGMGALSDGRLAILATTLAEGEGRTDSDLVLFAVTTDGAVDESFGESGRVVIDIDNASINARNVSVVDGMILATGYGNIGGVVSPVIARVSEVGELDASFGEGGIATAQVLPGVAESYAVVPQGDNYISAGYGRGADETEKVDLIVDRWSADGEWDQSFGTDGVTRVDLAGQDDRARNVAVLPDGRILAVGSGKMTEPDVDAMIVLMSEDGEVDAEFGTDGHILIDLGGPGDAFYGVAIAADGESVIVAGYKGADPEGSDNDDAVIAKVTIG